MFPNSDHTFVRSSYKTFCLLSQPQPLRMVREGGVGRHYFLSVRGNGCQPTRRLSLHHLNSVFVTMSVSLWNKWSVTVSKSSPYCLCFSLRMYNLLQIFFLLNLWKGLRKKTGSFHSIKKISNYNQITFLIPSFLFCFEKDIGKT